MAVLTALEAFCRPPRSRKRRSMDRMSSLPAKRLRNVASVSLCAALLCLTALTPVRASAEVTGWIANILGYGDLTFLYPRLTSTRAGACYQSVVDTVQENLRIYDYYVSQGDEEVTCLGQIEVVSIEPCTYRALPTVRRANTSISCPDISIATAYTYPIKAITIPDSVISQAKASGPEKDDVCYPGNPINPGNGNKYQAPRSWPPATRSPWPRTAPYGRHAG